MGFLSNVQSVLTRLGLTISVFFRFAWTGYTMPPKYRFFSEQEVKDLDPELCAMLDLARGLAGVPFQITSGFRNHDVNAGLPEAVQDSSHLTGHAVDLACSDSSYRYRMIKSLLSVGFTRLGVYSAHLHADNDPTKPPNVIWYRDAG